MKRKVCDLINETNKGYSIFAIFSKKLTLDFETTEEGYLYIYVANESAQTNVDVYFDDIKLMHSTTMVAQTNPCFVSSRNNENI